MYELIDFCFCFWPKVFLYVNGFHLLGMFVLAWSSWSGETFFRQSCDGPVCGDIAVVAGGIVVAVP